MNRFSIVEGHYLFCSLHHGGQSCPLYARLGRIAEYFTPGPMWSESRILSDEDGEHIETLDVYYSLCSKHGIDMIELDSGDFGTFRIVHDDGRDVLVQTDWDHPGLASTFGWISCECGETDGTIDCDHRTSEEMMGDACEYLNDNIGKRVEDPGYFSG